jgi:uncharacterized protein YcbK (DUF882 family)
MRRVVAFLIFALSSSAAPSWADTPREGTYVVKDGDTLSGIAFRHNVSVQALAALNRLDKDKPLKLGKTLTLPAPNPAGDGRGGGPTGNTKEASLGGGSGVKPGVVRLVRGQETLELRVLDKRGRLVKNTLPEFTRFLRFPDGSTHDIDARLVTLLATLSDHFGGRDIIVVSGFRPYSPRQFTPHSNHNAGRAIDFMVRGIPNETVRDFCRRFRNAGVGYYPNSAFVHLDVRDASAFWIDYAASGQAPRYHRPESKDEADEGAGEVEGVATVDSPGGARAGSNMTSSSSAASRETSAGKPSERGLTSDHSVFQGQN